MESTLARATSLKPPLEAVLAAMPIFEGLSPARIALLGACALRTQFRAGQMIFRQGEPANRFFLIESGKVGLISEEKGETSRFGVLGANDVLGWSWLFPPHTWHFTARAVTPTDAIFFYGTQLREACESDHDLGYELMKRFSAIMVQRLQSARAELIEARREIYRFRASQPD